MNKPSIVKSLSRSSLRNSPFKEHNSLSAVYNPSLEQAIAAGSTFELRVGISNQGLNG